MTHRSSRVAAAAAFAGVLAVPFVAHADLVLNEHFLTGADPNVGEYLIGPATRLHTQGPNVPGYAAGSVWGGGTLTTQPQVVEGSLDAPGASYEAGGKVQFDSSPVDNTYRSRARNLATPYAAASPNGPVYLSGMIETDAFPDNPANVGLRGYALFGFTSAVGAFGVGSTNTLAGYYLGFRATANDTVDLILRHRQGTTATPNAVQEDIVLLTGASVDTTYQFLVRADVNTVSGNQEAVRWWINPTDVTSENTATTTALATGTFNDFSLQTANDNIARTTVASYNWDTNFYVDELRLGTTFGEVAGPPVVPTLIGDTNDDGVVDLADLNNVLNNFGNTGASPGDDNGDGVVDLADLNNVLNNFGNTAPAAALSVVPEPSAVAFLLATLPLVSRRRRRA